MCWYFCLVCWLQMPLLTNKDENLFKWTCNVKPSPKWAGKLWSSADKTLKFDRPTNMILSNGRVDLIKDGTGDSFKVKLIHYICFICLRLISLKKLLDICLKFEPKPRAERLFITRILTVFVSGCPEFNSLAALCT